jgi:hypothetical protein
MLIPYSHSIVLIESNELICRRKFFLHPENSRRSARQIDTAIDFKGEFSRSQNSSPSLTVDIDLSTSFNPVSGTSCRRD